MIKTLYIKIILLSFLTGVGIFTIKQNSYLFIAVGSFFLIFIFIRYISNYRNLIFIKVIFVFLGLFLGFSRVFFFPHYIDSDAIDYFADPKIVQTIEGEIVKEPIVKDQDITYILGDVKLNNESKNGDVLVKINRSYDFRYGDKLLLKGKISIPENTDDFAYKEYLAMKGVYAILKNPKVIEHQQNKNGFYTFIFRFKLYTENKVKNILKEPHASFLNGLLFGSKKGMPEDVLNDFKITGLTHIIAISGYNITIIIIIVLAVFSFLPRKIQLIFAGLFIILFTIFVGAEASVVRASLMGILSLLALYSGRSQDITHILILVASIMIMMNYRVLIFDVGFQLSFMATAGLVYISPMIEKYFKWLPDIFAIRESFLLTMSAQITALPIILYNFGSLSVISPFANVLVAPFLPIAMLFGFLAFIFGVISMKLGVFMGFFAYLSLDMVLQIAYYLSRLDFASFDVPKFSVVYLFVYYFVIYILFRRSLEKI